MTDRMYTWMDEWKDGEQANGGIFYRAFDLVTFIEKVENTQHKKVVGIKFEMEENKLSPNIELITK